MGGKTRSETAAAFLKRLSGQEKDREAKEWTEKAIELAKNQQVVLSVLGTVSIVVVPGGAFHFTLSPHLTNDLAALDWVEQAISDAQRHVRELRKRVVERDLTEAKQQVITEEVTDQED